MRRLNDSAAGVRIQKLKRSQRPWPILIQSILKSSWVGQIKGVIRVASDRTRVLKIGWGRSGIFLERRSQSYGTGFLVWRVTSASPNALAAERIVYSIVFIAEMGLRQDRLMGILGSYVRFWP
jgi:hypothetical protein